MFPAFITTIFFSLSAIFASRAARVLGAATANLGRLCIALLLLGLWANTMGQGLRGPSLWWFFLSGFVGYGLGDVALFQAYLRIGPRLGVLIVHCLAVPIGALTEYLWLGTTLRPVEIGCVCLILAGVWMALTPVRHLNLKDGVVLSGIFFGVCASIGQSEGAVISRKAYAVAAAAGLRMDGGTAAFQRMTGGILVAGAFALMMKYLAMRERAAKNEPPPPQPAPDVKRGAWIAMVLHAISGPTLGVACYQWALSNAPSGLVLPIVATTPVVSIPLTYWLDGDRPSTRSVAGGVAAVAGSVLLGLVRAGH